MAAHAQTEETVLLILPKDREMYPLSTVAYEQAQTSQRNLANKYAGALVLNQRGEVRKIERIEVVGPLGKTVGRKLVSLLTSAWSIKVHFSDQIPIPLDEIRTTIMSCMETMETIDSLDIESDVDLEKIKRAIGSADSVYALVKCLKLPNPDAALDVL